MNSYFIEENGLRQGPFDMPAILRKIRAGKLTGETPVWAQGAASPVPAIEIDELATLLHSETLHIITAREAPDAHALFSEAVKAGWHFITLHPIVCALSGCGIMGGAMLGYLTAQRFGLLPGIGIAVLLFHAAQYILAAFILRLYRGQYIDGAFFRDVVAPITLPLIVCAFAISAVALATGPLVILPAGLLAVLSFAPFYIIDRKQGVREAIRSSVAMVRAKGVDYFSALFGLEALNIIALMLIFPLPLVLPLTTAALADLYDRQ